jgi:hypothetical protein
MIRIPHPFGLPRATATPIHSTIAMTMFTRGIRNRMIHQTGFLAMFSIRKMLAIGIHASHPFAVLVF